MLSLAKHKRFRLAFTCSPFNIWYSLNRYNYSANIVSYRNNNHSVTKNNIYIQQVFTKHKNSSHDSIRNYSTNSIDKNIPDQTIKTNNPFQSSINLTRCKSWTKEQVYSLLCTEHDKGGINLSIEQVKLLEDIGFDGISLSNIVHSIITNGLEDTIILTDNNYPNIPKVTMAIRAVVFWIDKQLETIKARNPSSSPSESYLQRLQDQHVRFGQIKTTWTIGDKVCNSPLVDRFESILETIESIYTPDLADKPKLTLISTSKGMGKSTFLCFCIKQFLGNRYLMEKFIFGDIFNNDIEISTRLSTSQDFQHQKRAYFVNKLNLAYSIGHFIPFECNSGGGGGAETTLSVEQLFLHMIQEHMKRMFVGVEVILEKDKDPILISSLDQLLILKNVNCEENLLLRFSELVQLNAPKVKDLFNIPYYEGFHQLPLILIIDSFHHLNVDTSDNGTLNRLGVLWFSLRMKMKGYKMSPALIVAADSLPNQFTSQDLSFFKLNVVNLDLLIGASIFNSITFKLFGAFLNSSVLEEQFGENTIYTPITITTPTKQLSPNLSRIIISILLLCCGNGRAIEKVYEICGLEIIKMVQSSELSNTSTEIVDCKQIVEKAKSIVSTFANEYSDGSISYNFNTSYMNLIKIMGVVRGPHTVILNDNVTMEDLQKIGWFVKTHVHRDKYEASYVGSFMLLQAFTENQVPELQNLLDETETDEFKHITITYNDLLTPYSKVEQLKGDHFSKTIAGSVWARYCIACLENNVSIGSLISIGKVLPKKMIPPNCLSGL